MPITSPAPPLPADLFPETAIESLYVRGCISVRAYKVLRVVQVETVRALAAYHLDDPRYLTLSGCGKTTRRELNRLIKAAYGTISVKRSAIFPPAPSKDATPAAMPPASSWAERWAAAERGENHPQSATKGLAAYSRRCEEYARFILERRGIPESLEDIRRHQWYLRQQQAKLSAEYRKKLAELRQKIEE